MDRRAFCWTWVIWLFLKCHIIAAPVAESFHKQFKKKQTCNLSKILNHHINLSCSGIPEKCGYFNEKTSVCFTDSHPEATICQATTHVFSLQLYFRKELHSVPLSWLSGWTCSRDWGSDQTAESQTGSCVLAWLSAWSQTGLPACTQSLQFAQWSHAFLPLVAVGVKYIFVFSSAACTVC